MPPAPMLLCLPPLARPLGSAGVPLLGGQGRTLMDSRQGDAPLALPPFSLPRTACPLSSLFLMFCVHFLAVNSFSSVFFFFFFKKNGKGSPSPGFLSLAYPSIRGLGQVVTSQEA